MGLFIAAFVMFARCPFAFAINIDTVPIGNPGNTADTRYFIDAAHLNGVGAVDQPFKIGKTEVTNAQYVQFLNAVAAADPYGLYNENTGIQSYGGILQLGSSPNFSYVIKPSPLRSGYIYDNKPVVYVSSADAMRFANWLHNGQPTGAEDATTTEDGAYTLKGAITDDAVLAVSRNPSARWWLPNEDEWYKAAYYDPASGSYYDYPTGTSDQPNNNSPTNDTGNSADFLGDICQLCDSAHPYTDAGAYALSHSPYGTFDQGGNALEWTETLSNTSFRILRGGSWYDRYYYLRAGNVFYTYRPTFEDGSSGNIGFRVASTAVPEPGGLILALCGLTAIFAFQRRIHRGRLHGCRQL